MAGDGGKGTSKLKHGNKGDDVEIAVPVGTELWACDGDAQLLADLQIPGARVLVARGGGGGRGNTSFVWPTNRFPLLAEGGDAGEELKLRLELKLLGDVGIIGAPNAGKSSLLATLSAARPRIAEYPFTTLEPVLGVAEHRDRTFVVVDVPGLIEGAHRGVGLGHRFLRHVERTRLLVHVLDGSMDDLVGAYRQVRDELGLFNADLVKKPEIIAVNKMDLPGVEARYRRKKEALGRGEIPVHCISAAGRQGLDGLLDSVVSILYPRGVKEGSPVTGEGKEPVPVLRPRRRDRVEVVRQGGKTYLVSSRAAQRVAAMLDGSNWDAQLQFLEHLRKLGVLAALERAGIRPGETFRVGKLELEWQ